MAAGVSCPGAGFPERHRIGIIVLNYNGSALTRACVESVLAHTPPALDYVVLVVDNGSATEDRDQLGALGSLDRVCVISSRINLGFGGGLMFGLQFLAADLYLFLNSDCLFENDVLGTLTEFMEQNVQVGLASCLTFDSQGRFRANYHPAPNVAELLFGRALARRFNPARYPDRGREPRAPLAVEVVGGAALFARAEAFFAVGGFDPFFFLYCEEEDLAWRLRRAGWSTYIVPTARLQHKGGGSTPKDPAYRREFFISFMHYLRKHHSAPAVWVFRLLYCVKLLRHSGREPGAASLAGFVLRGATPAASLRFRQPPPA